MTKIRHHCSSMTAEISFSPSSPSYLSETSDILGVHAWDIAAGCLIVSEAGGVIMSLDGQEFDLCKRQICVSNFNLRDEVRKLVQS